VRSKRSARRICPGSIHGGSHGFYESAIDGRDSAEPIGHTLRAYQSALPPDGFLRRLCHPPSRVHRTSADLGDSIPNTEADLPRQISHDTAISISTSAAGTVLPTRTGKFRSIFLSEPSNPNPVSEANKRSAMNDSPFQATLCLSTRLAIRSWYENHWETSLSGLSGRRSEDVVSLSTP